MPIPIQSAMQHPMMAMPAQTPQSLITNKDKLKAKLKKKNGVSGLQLKNKLIKVSEEQAHYFLDDEEKFNMWLSMP